MISLHTEEKPQRNSPIKTAVYFQFCIACFTTK